MTRIEGSMPKFNCNFLIYSLTKCKIFNIIIRSSGESVNPDYGFALFSTKNMQIRKLAFFGGQFYDILVMGKCSRYSLQGKFFFTKIK